MIKVKDHDNLARGAHGAIHNTDKEGFESYMAQREKKLNEEQRLDRLENQVSNIENALSVIIKLLEK